MGDAAMKQFFRIGPILVSQASALSGGLLMGMPALYAYTGFLKNLSLRLTSQHNVTVKAVSIAPIFHSFSLHRGHAKYVRYRPGQLADVAARGPNHPTVDEQRSTFEVSLIIVLVCSDFTFTREQITPCLRGMKLAGGGISASNGQPNISVRCVESVTEALRGAPFNAVMLADASYVLEDAQAAGVPKFDALLHALSAPNKDWELKPGEEPRPNWLPDLGSYLPVCIGAVSLESFKDPSQRAGIRQSDHANAENPTRHAFAESVFSLVRAQTVASVKAQTLKDMGCEPSVFWQEASNQEAKVNSYFGVQSLRASDL
jgi:CRISPR type I-F-associated protein Csy2